MGCCTMWESTRWDVLDVPPSLIYLKFLPCPLPLIFCIQGNISTSDMRLEDDEWELEVQTRFPMFGGWQTQFYIG
jgi:Ribophorin I